MPRLEVEIFAIDCAVKAAAAAADVAAAAAYAVYAADAATDVAYWAEKERQIDALIWLIEDQDCR